MCSDTHLALPPQCWAAGGTPHWDAAWGAASSLITSTEPPAVGTSEAGFPQWGDSTRLSQPRPDSNESFLKRRRKLSCCSVDMQLTWDGQNGHTYSAWSWLRLYHIWPQKPISGFHPSLVEQGQRGRLSPTPQRTFRRNPKTRHSVEEWEHVLEEGGTMSEGNESFRPNGWKC